MTFRINRVRVALNGDTGFSKLVSALPGSVDKCLCCSRPIGRRVAMILIADESDDNPLAVYSAVCLQCSAVQPRDQILADWAEELIEQYGGTDIPDMHGSGRVGPS
jgi:hypothetical protein